ncbi:DoxX family protein [Streptomyces sp. NBC_01725]|uniref:DoxX family protein n=1 Tax=Streptomyces sp. NBC_01725 TaxID=2975923 RepID=UPI002E2D2509|nr:DoxX family protein [Streptomyces sp. NBC_01725]
MSEVTTTPARTASAPAPAAVSPSHAGPSRRTDITVRTLQIVLALFLAVASAGPKLVGHSSAAESFDAIGFGDWFMYLTGALEVAGAVALLIPILSGVSAIALIGLMIGAFITQLTVFDGENALTPVIFLALLAVVAWVRRRRTAEFVALVRRRI